MPTPYGLKDSGEAQKEKLTVKNLPDNWRKADMYIFMLDSTVVSLPPMLISEKVTSLHYTIKDCAIT